jgi:hypothetical protein
MNNILHRNMAQLVMFCGRLCYEFNVHGSVHRNNILIYISNKMKPYTVYFIWKLLYMFRAVPPPIIRSVNNCIYSIWYFSHCYCHLPLKGQMALTVWQIPDAVDTVVYAPDDGWWYRQKHVEQFPDKINCVTLHLVGYILEYSFMSSGNLQFKQDDFESMTLPYR